MRILHVADSHLGYTAYAKLDENGYNQREVDVFDAFKQAIDKALALKVDAVVHAGDLFDSIRPSNRAMHFAIEQIRRVSEQGIPFIAISGNHSTPKLRETGSVFRLFEHLGNVHPIYGGAYEKVEIGDAVFHCVPHCASQDAFLAEVGKVAPVPGKKNVAVLHCGVSGVHRFTTGEFNENVLPSGALAEGFDYVALGHYHEHTEVAPICFYAGSTERFSFGEAGRLKGVMEVDLDSRAFGFHELSIRPMLDLGRIDCKGLENKDIVRAAEEIISKSNPDGKILRITMEGMPRSQLDGLDVRAIRVTASDALYFEPRFEPQDSSHEVQPGEASFGDLRVEFEDYLKAVPVERLDKAKLLALGKAYLSGALDEREG